MKFDQMILGMNRSNKKDTNDVSILNYIDYIYIYL